MEIHFNKQYPFIERYKKIANTQQGISTLIIAMMDPLHSAISAQITYSNPDEADEAIEYARSILQRCSHIKLFIRHVEALKEASKNTMPKSIDDYKKDNQLHTVVDIYTDGAAVCEFHFSIWGESSTRTLKIGF